MIHSGDMSSERVKSQLSLSPGYCGIESCPGLVPNVGSVCQEDLLDPLLHGVLGVVVMQLQDLSLSRFLQP